MKAVVLRMVASWALLSGSMASGQISFVGQTTQSQRFFTGGTLTLAVPSGVQRGDLLLLAATIDNGSMASVLWPSGFRQLRFSSADFDNQAWVVGYKMATGTEATAALTEDVDGHVIAALLAYRGVNSVDPIEVFDEEHTIDSMGTPGPWALSAPSVTLSVPGVMAVWVAGMDNRTTEIAASSVFTAPSGYLNRYDLGEGLSSLGVAEHFYAGAQMTGPISGVGTWPNGGSANTEAMLVALRPATAMTRHMAVEYLGYGSAAAPVGGAATIAAPQSLQSGDLLVLIASIDTNDVNSMGIPSGFTVAASGVSLTPDVQAFVVAHKVAGPSEGPIVVTTNVGQQALAAVLVYRNATFGRSACAVDTVVGGTPGPWRAAAPSIDTTAANSRLVWFGGIDDTGGFGKRATPPAGFVERHDQSVHFTNLAIADAIQPSAGASGSIAGSFESTAGVVANPFACVLSLEPVDSTPPDTFITAAPSGTVSSPDAQIAFSSPDGTTFECSTDGAVFLPCASPLLLTGVSAGSHSVSVRAVDDAGNVDPTPASAAWLVVFDVDAGGVDSGGVDAGGVDAGDVDSGVDAGVVDAGGVDAGSEALGPRVLTVGCGCSQSGGLAALGVCALSRVRRPRRRTM